MPTATALSIVSARIDMSFGDEDLGGGTAFYYAHGGGSYLVTNWHNLSGRNPATGQPIHSEGGIPDRFRIRIPVVSAEGAVVFCEGHHPLYKDEQNTIPIWWEHPVHAEKVDIAVIDISAAAFRERRWNIVCVNDPKANHPDVGIRVGQDVFTVGFPRLMDGGGLAIWKRGSIATEPSLDLGGLPKFYIDSATREGMSGSPVFASGLVSFRNPSNPISSIGIRQRFIGIYSGRVGDDTFLAQLGIVWKESAIIETIEARKTGQTSF